MNNGTIELPKGAEFDKSTTGYIGIGVDSQGRHVAIFEDGTTARFSFEGEYSEFAPKNTICNAGVGLLDDLPLPVNGYTYATSDTFEIWKGIEGDVYEVTNIDKGQFVTDIFNDPNVFYQFNGLELLPISSGSSVTICDQADVEVEPATENTKATSSLRAYQGFKFWAVNTVFNGMQTAVKTIQGAINEILGLLDLKATQNTGICQMLPIEPEDIVIDPAANTLTIATINGGETISASNPIRFYTDGSGIVTKWEKTTPQVFNFTNTNGVWYFHFDNTGAPIATQTAWGNVSLIAQVYRFYLNDTLPDATKIVTRAYEAHRNVMSAAVHELLHADGTRHLYGFDIVSNQLTISSGVPTTAPNADGSNTVIALTTGKNSDDGLEYVVNNTTTPTNPFDQDLGQTTALSLNATNSGLFKIRTNDASGKLNFLDATRFPFPFNAANNFPQYITTTGVRTDVGNQKWFVVFIYSFSDDKIGEPVKVVTANTQFDTYSAATAFNWANIQTLYATLQDKEIRPLYKLIYYCKNSTPAPYLAGCKFSALVQKVDIRTFQPSTVTSSSGGTVLASNVVVTPPSGFVSTDQQSFDSEIAGKVLSGTTTEKVTPIGADSVSIWDSVASSFKRVTFTNLKAYVLNLLSASQVVNDSSNVTGATVKDVFDNAVEPTEVTELADTDILFTATPVTASEVTPTFISLLNLNVIFTTLFNSIFSGKSSDDLAHTTSGAVLTNVGDEIRANKLIQNAIGIQSSENAASITVLQGSSDILVTQPNITVDDTPYDLIPDGYELIEASYTCVSGCDGLFIMQFESLAGSTFDDAGASIDATSVNSIQYISSFSESNC